jgi:hemerythrin
MELLRYAADHFLAEENLMKEYGFPALEAHIGGNS